jgi:hypothetical protein
MHENLPDHDFIFVITGGGQFDTYWTVYVRKQAYGPILEQGKDFAGNIVWIFGNCKRMIPTRKTYNKLVKSAPGKNMGVPFIRIAND